MRDCLSVSVPRPRGSRSRSARGGAKVALQPLAADQSMGQSPPLTGTLTPTVSNSSSADATVIPANSPLRPEWRPSDTIASEDRSTSSQSPSLVRVRMCNSASSRCRLEPIRFASLQVKCGHRRTLTAPRISEGGGPPPPARNGGHERQQRRKDRDDETNRSTSSACDDTGYRGVEEEGFVCRGDI